LQAEVFFFNKKSFNNYCIATCRQNLTYVERWKACYR